MSSKFEAATMGAARAKGDEIDDGVEDRVWKVLGGQYWGTGAGKEEVETLLDHFSSLDLDKNSPLYALVLRLQKDVIGPVAPSAVESVSVAFIHYILFTVE